MRLYRLTSQETETPARSSHSPRALPHSPLAAWLGHFRDRLNLLPYILVTSPGGADNYRRSRHVTWKSAGAADGQNEYGCVEPRRRIRQRGYRALKATRF
jgi:hypothetical protein